MSVFTDVAAFQGKFLGPAPKIPTLLPPMRWEERFSHLMEELMETDEAHCDGRDLPAVVDGLLDLIYVASGCLHQLGMTAAQSQKCWDAIHRANMAKELRPTKRYPTGDVVKPAGWKHPNLAALIGVWQPELPLESGRDDVIAIVTDEVGQIPRAAFEDATGRPS